MRALSVRQPHAEAIMRGIKEIEYRSQVTNIRERIYIYASKTRTRAEEADMMAQYGIDDVECNELPRGVLVGTVEIADCTDGGDYYHWHLVSPKPAGRLRKPTNQPQPVWFNPF